MCKYLLINLKRKEKNTKEGLKAIILSPSLELSSQIYRELIFLNHQIDNKLKIRLLSNLNSNHKTLHEQQLYIDILVYL
jgi:hypothetical protein